MNWTTAQREAIETRGQRILVSAGAGSGKTRVLVERFLKLLEDNPDWKVTDIVAVTFTEKAAREMVSRIRREIRSRIERSTDVGERRRWREHRNGLDSARIGTIHSLCAAILRAHPIEAELDPAFEVLEEIEASVLLDEAIEEALNDAAQQSAPEAAILLQLTTVEVKNALRSLIQQGERALRTLREIALKSADEIAAYWRETIARKQLETAAALLENTEWQRHVHTITQVSALKANDKLEVCRVEAVNLLEVVNFNEDDTRLRALGNLADLIKVNVGARANWASEEDLKTVKAALKELREMVRGEEMLKIAAAADDKLAAEQVLHLIKLYHRVRQHFAALKNEQAALDFNDLEEITDRLLTECPEIAALYNQGSRLRALMVDEFQDTAPIQKRILWQLAPESRELFIIGDAKQSIYRFRGADVTVFETVRSEFTTGGEKVIGMNACFRTHTRLIDFVNHLFPRIFTRDSLYDTPYEAMSASRAAHHDKPSVEIHIIEQAKQAEETKEAKINPYNTAELRRLEAALIARRISEIIENGEILINDDNGDMRKAEAGDFALLFQAATHFDLYEQALADAGIPYVTIAGKGFYARQEIADISNLLTFLVSPIDDLSLASVLRSPMFAFSDEMLLRLRLVDAPLAVSLYDETIEFAEDERDVIAFARQALTRLRGLTGRVSAAKLIIEAMRETGYLATMMGLPNGERRVSNIEKLIEQTYGLSHLSLSEVVERINNLKFKEAREGEATIEETGAVRLMTVHKSKGLEFPIVWVVDSAYGGNRDRSLLALHEDFGMALNVREENPLQNKVQAAAAFEAIKLIEEKMEKAEKKRLLYVATTRAREHLILSGSLSKKKLIGDHWLGQIARALSIDETTNSCQLEYQGGHIAFYKHDTDTLIEENRLFARARQANATLAESKEMSNQEFTFPLLRKLA
jgi:ATP-dependent helicase/nuclease subunit A